MAKSERFHRTMTDFKVSLFLLHVHLLFFKCFVFQELPSGSRVGVDSFLISTSKASKMMLSLY